MLSLTRFQFHFIANWRFAVLTLIFCLFFSRLGYWQLARAEEKKHMLNLQSQLATHSPQMWSLGDALPTQYQPVQVKGHFSPVIFLLDNQHYQHQFGYNVLSPLILDENHVVLIDRGWIPGQAQRESIPTVNVPSGIVDITGSAYYPSKKTWSLGNVLEKKQAHLAVIELIDVQIVEQFLHKSVYPFIIRLDAKKAHGFVRDWPVVAMPPERHIAYAIQWFAMAFVILILFIVLNIKKKT